MAIFLNIAEGETKTDRGIRLTIREDGEQAWFHGKWLDLAADHAVAWIDRKSAFIRADGKKLVSGDFPAWVVRSSRKGGAFALMFNATQFIGGNLVLGEGRTRLLFPIQVKRLQKFHNAGSQNF